MRRHFIATAVAAGFAFRSEAAVKPFRIVASGLDPFDAEVLDTFAKTQGRPLERVAGTEDALDRGTAEVFAGLYLDRVPARLAPTSEVLPSRLVALTRRPADRAAAIESLRWSRIGVLRGSRAESALSDSKVSGAETADFEAADEALSALRAGEVKALVWELPDALVARTRDRSLDLGVFLGGRRSRVYAVGREAKPLLADLNAFLHSFRSSPSWAALLVRVYGPDALEVMARAHLAD